ncbi:MAG TPA: LPXTG cell wall anchor domain-containing protein [Clostridiaceae bacterium]|nr:LPXTG cell wall anchor domain-containing protein [Clostridiaceae bacterium]
MKNTKKNFFGLFLFVIFTLILSWFSPAASLKAASQDKSNLLTDIGVDIRQSGLPVNNTNPLNPKNAFNLKFNFTFPILKDANIPIYESGDPNFDADKQVDEGDFAFLKLGKNFRLLDTLEPNIPIYITTTGQVVGNITLGYDATTNEPTAKINFKSKPDDPKGQFNYEPDQLQNVTVFFEGRFEAVNKEAQTPPTENDVIQILDKTFKLPEKVSQETTNFAKSGKQLDTDTVEWTVDVSRTVDNVISDLGNFIFKDNLTNVGQFVPGSFKVNDVVIPDGQVYDSANNVLTYVFPENTNVKTFITFRTTIPWNYSIGETTKIIKNTATLTSPLSVENTTEKEVPVNRMPNIYKKSNGVNVNIAANEKSLLWTIDVGKAGYNYGPAWVSDILSSNIDGMAPPKRVELTVEKQLNDGTWQEVTLAEDFISADRPKYPIEKGSCPVIPPKYKQSEIYNFGENFQEPIKAMPAAPYKTLQTNWFFLPELNGVYKISLKHVFDMSVDIPANSIKNNAEVYICGDTVSPINPPIYTGIGAIVKSAKNINNSYAFQSDFRQGILPWDVEINLNGALPSLPHYVYEFFYYDSINSYKTERSKLTIEGVLPNGTFERLNQEKYVNANLSYIENSFSSKSNLSVKQVYPVMNGTKQVGEIVQIQGLDSPMIYSFSLKTQIQNFVHQASNTGKISVRNIKNTVALFTGEGSTLKDLSASDYYSLSSEILNKTAIEYDTNLNDLGAVSKDDGTARINNVKNVNTSRIFNHKDRTAYFRIDVNSLGIDLVKFNESIKNPNYKFDDPTKLTVAEKLPEGWQLVSVDDSNAKFALYEARPASLYSIGYSISFGGSARYLMEYYEPYATKRISNADIPSIVTFDEQKMEWTFNNSGNKTYMIIIKAQLSESVYREITETLKQTEPANTHINNVELKAGQQFVASNEEKVSIKPMMLEKNIIQNPMSTEDSILIDWTLDYRPCDIDKTSICYSNIVLTDFLDENIMPLFNDDGNLDNSKITVQRSNELLANCEYTNYSNFPVSDVKNDNSVSVFYNATEHSLEFSIPDSIDGELEYAYKIIYTTEIQPVNLNAESITNRVKLTANRNTYPTEGESVYSLKNNQAWASLKNIPFYVIQKSDSNDSAIVLPGSTFVLEKDGAIVSTKTTNAHGMIYFINLADGVYQLRETTAPENYELRTDVIEFTISNGTLTLSENNSSDIIGLGTLNNPIIISNKFKPSGTEPTVTDPTVTDPTKADPKVTDSTVTDLTVTDPTEMDPKVTDPKKADPASTTSACHTTEPDPNNLVRTGENTNYILIIGILLSSAITLIILRKKSKREKSS